MAPRTISRTSRKKTPSPLRSRGWTRSCRRQADHDGVPRRHEDRFTLERKTRMLLISYKIEIKLIEQAYAPISAL
ncbi:protein of unknown function (plasmid) [Rhodovastum atsumiense]|nr:protein of unknown function [Rhodovastum atsumiense]